MCQLHHCQDRMSTQQAQTYRETQSPNVSSVHSAHASVSLTTVTCREEKLKALVERLSTLEDSVLSTSRAPSATAPELVASSVIPECPPSSERPAKRRRTTITTEETSRQAATEARNLISKELYTNGLLSVHQRSVLETAISFVDHLTNAPVPTITDRSTFDRSMYTSTDLSHGEILHVILASQ